MRTESTLDHTLELVARRNRQRVAVAAGNSVLTYGALWRRSGELAANLAPQGIGEGAVVAVGVQAPDELVCVYVALLRLGAATVLLDPSWSSEAMVRAAGRAGARQMVVSAREGRELELVMVDTATGVARPFELRPASVGAGRVGKRGWGAGAGAVILATAGTTGEPKLVQHTHQGILGAYRLVQSGFRDFVKGTPRGVGALVGTMARKPWGLFAAARRRKVWMTTLPVFRVAGHALLMQALLGGETLVVGDRLRAEEVVEALGVWKVNVLAASPLMGEFLTRVGGGSHRECRHLLLIGLGSDRAAKDLPGRLEARFGCRVVVGYGTTEFGGGILATNMYGRPPAHEGEVGAPFRGVAVRIVDADGRIVAPGDVGRLECRLPPGLGGRVLGAEIGADDGAAEVNWISTGDQAWTDQAGRVFVLGRLDDVIVRGAVKIDPLEIEGVLERHPDVLRAGAVGLRSSSGVGRVVAYCQLREGHKATAGELRAFCRGGCGRRVPVDRVVIIEELPASVEGKVQRQELRRWARADPVLATWLEGRRGGMGAEEPKRGGAR